MENKVNVSQGVVCNHCGYPYNRGRRYCQVCGNDLHANKRLGLRPLTNNKVIAYTLIAISLIIAFVGIFGAVKYDCYNIDGDKYVMQTGISYFFSDGWKHLSDIAGQASFTTEAFRFGVEFATYLIALIGLILVTILFLISLGRRLHGKETLFCVHKCFCFLSLFVLPYVFAVSFLGNRRGYLSLDGANYAHVTSSGWGVILCFIAIVVAFLATWFSCFPETKRERKAFNLRQITSLLVLVVIGIAFCCAITAKTADGITKEGSIFWILDEFMKDAEIPVRVGILGLSSVVTLIVAFVIGLFVLFSKKNNFKIIYTTVFLGLVVLGSILSYLAGVGMNDYISNTAQIGYGHSFIISDVLGTLAVLSAISAKVRDEAF